MTRRDALKRLAIGVVYVPLYAFILYPISLAVGLVLGVLAVLWELATGDAPRWKQRAASRAWSYPSDNMKWLMTGEGDFELLP